MAETKRIGRRIEPFVDGFLIDKLDGVRRELQHPERREVVLTCDAPWESEIVGFTSIVQLEDRIRLYYRASTDRVLGEDFQCIAIAESFDGGFRFERPSLGLVEYDGSRDNNLIASGEQPTVPPPFLDTNPACREDERFKGLTSKWRKLWAMTSADGLSWRLMRDRELDMAGTFDTINTAFWDSKIGAYRSFTRFFRDVNFGAEEVDLLGADTVAVRSIQSSTSPDFIEWTEPTPHTYNDSHDYTQLYTNATVPCPGAEHLYLSFPNRYVQHRILDRGHEHPGVNDALFMCSRDATRWNRYLEAWVRPGLDAYNWTERNNYPVWGIVETSDVEWSIFVSEHYRRPGVPVRLRRLAIRPYGFISLRGDYDGGRVRTHPFEFTGEDLFINASTSAAGGIRVSVLDEHGRDIDGYGSSDMEEFFGDSVDARIRWGEKRLGSLALRPIRLSISLCDADLFAIRAG